MGKLLQDFQYEGKDLIKDLDAGKTWMSYFWEGATTFLWLIVATAAGNSSWAWALSYVVLGVTFGGSAMNSLCTFKEMIYGNTSIVHFALTMFSHVVGAIAAYQMAGGIGFTVPTVPAHGFSFGTWNWKSFFFGREFWGIFLFCLFHSKHNNDSGMPEKLWTMLIMATAFQVGGDGFVFVPSRMFTGFASFADGSVWCCFLSQIWAVLFASVIGDHVWKKYY